jgi:hypothetical protein
MLTVNNLFLAAISDRKQSAVATPNEHMSNDGVVDNEAGLSSSLADVHERCQWETLEAKCTSPDEVLLVTGAVYGRYHLGGRCIHTAYGPMACGRDAFESVSSRCSARPSCTFPVTSLHSGLLLQPSSSSSPSSDACPMELAAHLLVRYTCLRGEKNKLVIYIYSREGAGRLVKTPTVYERSYSLRMGYCEL